MGFHVYEPLPGIRHIEDGRGVCFTLVEGKDRALLVDTGYGLEDVAAQVRRMTDKPVTLWLTHAHHDHALGARGFRSVRICPAEKPVWDRYTARAWRERVLAASPELDPSEREAYLGAVLPEPELSGGETLDLGGLAARVIPCPGHTPGSAVVWVPERGLLLTGDDWNPCTWLFFDEALPVAAWRDNLRALTALPFEHVLCPHRTQLYPRRALEAFLDAITDEAVESAVADPSGGPYGIETRAIEMPDGSRLVFRADQTR